MNKLLIIPFGLMLAASLLFLASCSENKAQSKVMEASLYADEAHAEIAAKKAEEGKDKKKKPERKPVKLSSVVPTAADQQLIKDAEAEAEAEAAEKSGKEKKPAEERKVTAPTARR